MAQRFDLHIDGHDHRVVVEPRGLRQHVVWWVDDELVTSGTSAEEKVRLTSPEHGVLALRLSVLGRARRATWHPPGSDLDELSGGGTDLVPEPGSPAAAYEQRVREHPRRHVAQETAVAVLKVVVPIVVVALLARFAFAVPLPDLPSLPDLPLPDVPSLPLPDWSLPDWSLPGWAETVVEVLKYVVPVAIAFVLARAEVRRRRQQDEERRRED